VVGIGSSAGGLEALTALFGEMPPDTGMAFVVIQHLDPRRASVLPELLEKRARIPVVTAKDGVPLARDHVYVIPPNALLTLEHGVLRLSAPSDGPHNAVDNFFCSLAEDQTNRAVCIVLSGGGTDGMLGLKRIKENGGIALAQTAVSAKCDAMPKSAASTGLVDFVLPAEGMPAKLVEYLAHLQRLEHFRGPDALHSEVASRLGVICQAVRRRSGHDFSRYKQSTLIRRIQRRMQVLHVDSADGYVERLHQDPQEAEELFKDLLIGVTQFFRDGEAFDALHRLAIVPMLETAGADSRFRVWAPGCASGEEAYSIAIMICERLSSLDCDAKVQIFATDIDDQALEVARRGRYPESHVESVSEERLRRRWRTTAPVRSSLPTSSSRRSSCSISACPRSTATRSHAGCAPKGTITGTCGLSP
jgi:two-component system CheB/CheR fusion protein